MTAALVAWPIAETVRLSFYELRLSQLLRGHDQPFTLANYNRVLEGTIFWPLMMQTLVFTLVGTVAAGLLGLASALAFDGRHPAARAGALMAALPWSVAPVIASLVWMFMMSEQLGVLNYMLLATGIASKPLPFLTSPDLAIWSVTLAAVWKAYPYFLVMFLAGLQSIPPSIIEAARMDGAGRWRLLIDMRLPQLRPIMWLTGFFGVLSAFRNVETILVMTGGGPARSTETLAVRVYAETFLFLNPGRGAALGVLTFLVALAVSLPLLLRMRERRAT